MTRHAAAYIRRSSASGDSPGDASREAQHDATKRLAAAFAPDAELRTYTDWGLSGRKDDRPEYVKLKAEIEAGHVCCVFSYSLSRLGRTARELDVLFTLCEAHDVQVITQADGTLTATSATGKFLRRILGELAELESELAKERSASAREAKRDRGDVFGQAPYGYRFARDENRRLVLEANPDEPLQPILAAYKKAGSVLGAARLLKDDKVPAPRGGEDWATSMLTRTIEREWPEVLPQRSPAGRRSPSSAMFAQLLRCPFCDRMLTPNTARGQYYCANGPRDRERHPRYTVREVDVLPWIQAEADHLDIPADAVAIEGIEARQDAIQERLDRAREDYYSGADKNRDRARATWEAEQKRAERDLEALAGQATMAQIAPTVDWEARPEVINTALRSMWREVQLDDRLLPVAAEWLVSEWRTA